MRLPQPCFRALSIPLEMPCICCSKLLEKVKIFNVGTPPIKRGPEQGKERKRYLGRGAATDRERQDPDSSPATQATLRI